MKRLFFSAVVLLTIAMIACNNDENMQAEHQGHKKEVPQTKEDSLYADVMGGHDAVMPKMGKVRGAQQEAKRLLDSIATLPSKLQSVNAALKANLESLVNELNYADFAMDKWMIEFNMDSAKDNLEQRISYLTDEKMKVLKVKEAVLNSLAKADSLLKGKN